MRWFFPLLLLFAVTAQAAGPGKAAIASAHPLATDAGFQMLEQGGNAYDAAVAVAAALSVVEPYSAGMGGGGFWLLHREKDDLQTMLDARETAPAAATEDMYQDQDGQVVRDRAVNGALAAGIPGQAAAFAYLAEHYGKLPLKTTLAPAIKLARQGFEVEDHYRALAG
ncbi:MAG TPA: gamma-glutamyltransferase, partial [Alcanivorax sp.]|nr:gamma-glutamyltransferase [Alcanivorax sp.]